MKTRQGSEIVYPRPNAGHAAETLGEASLRLEICGFRPLAAFDFLAVGRLHARDLETPVGADHGEAVRFHRDDFAELAGDALRIFGRKRLGVENLEMLTVERRPRAGRGIAAADETVHLLPRLAPVDLGV